MTAEADGPGRAGGPRHLGPNIDGLPIHGSPSDGPCAVRLRGTRRGMPRRAAFACMKLGALVVVLAILGTGYLVARLSIAPMAIGDLLGPTITRALDARFGHGLRFGLRGLSLAQHGFSPTLSVSDLSVTGPDGTTVVNAPRAELQLDSLSLLFGSVVPKRLEVFDVTLRAVVLPNGNLGIASADAAHPFFEIGRGSDDAPSPAPAADTPAREDAAAPVPLGQPAPPGRAAVMRKAAAGLRQFLDLLTDPRSPVAAVDRLAISRGTLVLQDQESGEETRYRDFELGFANRGGETSFGASAAGPARRWQVAALAKGHPGEQRRFGFKVQDVTIDELKLAAGSRSRSFDSDAPLGMHGDIAVRADNTIAELSGGLDVGQGFVRTDDPDFEPLMLTGAGVDLHWNPQSRQVIVDSLRYDEGATHFLAAGELVTPVREGDPWSVSLHLAEPGLFAPDRKGQQPIPVASGQFVGRLLLDRKQFLIDRIAFLPRNGGAAVAGQIDWANGVHLRLGMSLDPTDVAVVERVWPSSIAANVRAWILNHFEAGRITEGTLQIDYDESDIARMRADRAPADKSVSIDFKVADGRLRYLDGVPPLEEIVGTAHITGRSSHFDIASGSSTVDGHKVLLRNGRFDVPDSSVHPILATLSGHLSGPVEGIVGILSRPALKPYASIPLDPATLHGRMEGDLARTMVLGHDEDPSKETMKVDATVSDLRADRLIGKEGLENAALTLTVADGVLRAVGQGRIFGGPATFDITRSGTQPPHALLGLTLDDAARAKLGLAVVPGIAGPVTAAIDTVIDDPAKLKAQVDVDLTRASVNAGLLGLRKPAGQAAKLAVTVATVGDHLVLDPVAAEVGSLQAKGSVALTADNALQAAHFGSFRISSGDDMKLDVARGEGKDGGYKLTVRGNAIDARPFFKALTGDAPTPAKEKDREKSDPLAAFDIDLKSNLLSGFNKEVMSGAELRLSKRDGAIRQFALQGRFGRQTLSGSMTANGRIKIAAQDAGALVSFIDLYKHMEGGQLAATMQLGDEVLSGSLEIRDFVLRDEPAIRRLVATSATLTAPGENTAAARRIDGDAVDFTRLKVNFEREGSRLELRDATMYGPQIGLSVDGWLDYSHDGVGLRGTYVPVFALNNLFSQIPVFGMFLGGKSNEGLLAITFNISGAASSPQLSINPLSAVAPGFLRNVFGALVEGPPPGALKSQGGNPGYPSPGYPGNVPSR